MSDDKALTELIEDAVDRGATTAEEIHRSIADLPLSVLERLGLLEFTTREVRRVQDVTLGAIYDAVREVNHKVSQLAADLLERRADEPAPGEGGPGETEAAG